MNLLEEHQLIEMPVKDACLEAQLMKMPEVNDES